MSKIVLTNCYVKVANVTLSDHVSQVTLNQSANEVETTAMGHTYTNRIGGMKEASIALNFHQDFDAGSVEATIAPLLGTIGTVVVAPNGSVASSTNPTYTCEVMFTEWSNIDGSVGDLATASVTWPCNNVTKATA
jgi:hypothetical protein